MVLEPETLSLSKFYAKHIKKETDILIPWRAAYFKCYRLMQFKSTSAVFTAVR